MTLFAHIWVFEILDLSQRCARQPYPFYGELGPKLCPYFVPKLSLGDFAGPGVAKCTSNLAKPGPLDFSKFAFFSTEQSMPHDWTTSRGDLQSELFLEWRKDFYCRRLTIGRLQLAVAPPLVPAQFQRYWVNESPTF